MQPSSAVATRGRKTHSLERLLVLAGTAALIYGGWTAVEVHAAKVRASCPEVASAHGEEVGASDINAAHVSTEVSQRRSELGRILIPSLGIAAPITSGIGDQNLREGVGHIPGTAMPGGLGTMGLAAHRDTFFRNLKDVKPAMQINVAAADGFYRYVVDSTEIVTPDRVDVVGMRDRPELTLVTCYPFHYVGAAPKRFIVHAHLLSVAPSGSTSAS